MRKYSLRNLQILYNFFAREKMYINLYKICKLLETILFRIPNFAVFHISTKMFFLAMPIDLNIAMRGTKILPIKREKQSSVILNSSGWDRGSYCDSRSN